ncbi:protein translocase subunit SecD [Aeromicrobium sp. Root472D3]|uniref:protein translocase subunit SecD n=1 Tax=Aeromicrobium sp. Root472D3 TaxID=1736540 RepID=UPI000701DE0E|nr:protein translocase subunit SecD [Aeromicrobium sp. Root472D3]KQX75585.1 preprotein translocase subunit SecD [Aeromicrobium sp. Root472D3]
MSSRAPMWRAIAAFAVIAVALLLALTSKANLGLDLKGGTQIVLETKDSERVKADAESTDRALTVIRGRVDALGVSEPTLARSGSNRIIVELPGVQDPREAAEVIGQTAQLSFHEVRSVPTDDTAPPEGETLSTDEDGNPIVLGPQLLDGNGVSDASSGIPEGGVGQWVVNVEFNGQGRGGWADLVSAACANPAAAQRVAIVLDTQVISSPSVQPSLCQSGGGASTQITGNFTQATADDLAILIKGGALPVPVETVEQRTVGPTLGKVAIDASIEAAIIGIALTGLFIVLVYRLVGFLATIALGTYALISYGMLVWLGATLTLPGLAGFVLAIGLAIDANVLVFERAREEYAERTSGGLEPALTTGFNKAWSAIIDSNVTTLLAAALLFFFASGPVKGFGVTLSIGVVASMVSALVIARVLCEWAVKRSVVKGRPAISGLAGTGRIRQWLTDSGPDLMKRSGTWIVITLVVAVVSVGGIAVKGLNLGVEFTGGRLLEYSTSQAIDAEDARVAVSDAGFSQAVVQSSSGEDGRENVSVRLDDITNEEAVQIEEALAAVAGSVEKERDELIGPSLGKELRDKALIAFAIAIAAQMLYLAWRFRWTYAAAAVLSMSSVVLTVVGVFAWWGKPIDGVFLAAVLSIIGLAVNDTIVVFDRIREYTAANRKKPLRGVVNEAILQTIPRTINTGLGAMFILAALAVLGGDSLTDFAIALLIGLSVGILSTIFTASAIAILLEERWPYDPTDAPKKVIDPYANVDDGRTTTGAIL